MSVQTGGTTARAGDFAAGAMPPAAARARAAVALLDTVGVTLAGVREPASRIVQEVVAAEGGDVCQVIGTRQRASATGAALATGTAAHALDYDDMCFVSLAHPSAPLIAAIICAGELAGASGRALIDAYVIGFEIEARLGRLMNPRHYQRGWHCTSTLGTIGAAAAVSRLIGLDGTISGHALGIAASEASGVKENFGTMVKPLHAGLAARNGVLAALLARGGMTASDLAIEGPQGFLAAMDSQRSALDGELDAALGDLGVRWEILDTGITVKLYPSCAATHPSLDAILDLQRQEAFAESDVEAMEIEVDPVTPTVLIHDRPKTGLEAKFSMQFCAAAAVVYGHPGIDMFEGDRLRDPRIGAVMSRVAMRVDPTLGTTAPPLTQARVRVRLRDGRTVTKAANGARGYPEHPASDDEIDAKFLACARRTISEASASQALAMLHHLEELGDIRQLTAIL